MFCHKKVCERRTVLENKIVKLVWHFKFRLRKTTTARRPDLTHEDKAEKKHGFATWHSLNNGTLRQKG